MRSPPAVLAVLALFVLCGHAIGDPAKPWDETVQAPGSYDCTSYGPSAQGAYSWVYGWDLTFHGWDLLNNPSQQLYRFVVYEAGEITLIGGAE